MHLVSTRARHARKGPLRQKSAVGRCGSRQKLPTADCLLRTFLLLVAVARRGGQVGQLVGEAGGVAAVASEAEALEARVGEAELGRELLLVEQPDLVRRRPR